jgi:DNA primase
VYNPKFDFKYLKTKVSIDQVLAAYSLDSKLRRQNHTLVGPCPIHGGDNHTAFRVDLNSGRWHCFTSCGGGDIVDLIRHIERCSFAEAARQLSSLIDSPTPSSLTSTPQPSTFTPFVSYIPLRPRVSFLQEVKKISVQTALHYETGTTNKSHFLRNTVAVRLHDLSGNPLGYCGRNLDQVNILAFGKWRFPKGFPKNNILYNAHRALPYLNQGIVVVECPWAVMRLGQAGINNAVALLGTSISPIQAAWLAQAPAILLMLDGDQAGRKAASAIAGTLNHKTKVYTHHLPENMEPEDLSDENLLSLVSIYFHLF